MDIIDLLKQQHREAEALFEAFRNAPDAEVKAQLCVELAEALTLHTTIEERWVYPVARRIVGEGMIDHSVEEHGEMRQLISDMLRSRVGGAGLDGKVRAVEAVVKEHVAKEEHDVLPRLGEKASEKDFGMSCKDIVSTASRVRREEMSRLEAEHPA